MAEEARQKSRVLNTKAIELGKQLQMDENAEHDIAAQLEELTRKTQEAVERRTQLAQRNKETREQKLIAETESKRQRFECQQWERQQSLVAIVDDHVVRGVRQRVDQEPQRIDMVRSIVENDDTDAAELQILHLMLEELTGKDRVFIKSFFSQVLAYDRTNDDQIMEDFDQKNHAINMTINKQDETQEPFNIPTPESNRDENLALDKLRRFSNMTDVSASASSLGKRAHNAETGSVATSASSAMPSAKRTKTASLPSKCHKYIKSFISLLKTLSQDEIQDRLNCSRCHTIPKNARLSACHHIHCQKCLQKMKTEVGAKTSVDVPCGICGKLAGKPAIISNDQMQVFRDLIDEADNDSIDGADTEEIDGHREADAEIEDDDDDEI